MKLRRTIFKVGFAVSLVWGISASASNVFVSDPSNGSIVQFDSAGNEHVFASGLDTPAGLVVDGNGNLYAADSGNGTILRITSSGAQSTFASGPNDPTGLALADNGNLFVADQGDGTIWQFDSNGSGSIFASGLALNADPTHLSFDGAGNLYASGTHSVQEFYPDASESTIFSAFNYVSGVAADRNGDVYASIQNAGGIVRILGTAGPAVPLSYPFAVNPFQIAPTGLALDDNGNLYAAFVQLGASGSLGNAGGAIMVFDPNGTGSILATGLNSPNYIAVQNTQSIPPVFVPEPSTWSLMLSGFVMMVGISLHRRFFSAGETGCKRA